MPNRTSRIRQQKENDILEAALDVFSARGFRGSTLDQIAERAGLSKPNLLYYFSSKEDVHRRLLARLLENWLNPLQAINAGGEPMEELRRYVSHKLELARDYPRESRLFANEILQGAPHIQDAFPELKSLVDEIAIILKGWMKEGQLRSCDPHHLIFSIWATTQHYADFDAQVRAVLGPKRGGDDRFKEASQFLDQFYLNALRPEKV